MLTEYQNTRQHSVVLNMCFSKSFLLKYNNQTNDGEYTQTTANELCK